MIWLFLKVFCGFKVEGSEHIPRQGGFILAPNHVSYFDPPTVGCGLPLKVHYMAKQELFKIPLLGGWMRAVGTFPLKRGKPDRVALHRAVQILKEGGCVCIFPEGTRVAPGKKKSPESGVALLAEMAKVPILPAAIIGTQPLFQKRFSVIPWFSKITVRLGKPMHLRPFDPSKKRSDVYKEVASQVLKQIQKLKTERSNVS